ncbi:hypothetical protein [Pedococcus sp. 5OH_020]|uniref:hypothetical protein n=1 Tax=Pedococcus sp. 5OH_020 TaxID=2989814 RepID=UPI0022EA0911|nr:hypothetical protein [Pedococcus sp. 5OH_020]
MTEMRVRAGGGWNTDYTRMSYSLRSQVESADRAFARETANAERERAARAAAFRDGAVRASIAAALDRGEHVDLRQAWADGGVGRTHAEVLAEASARMDLDDRRQAWRRAKEGAALSDAEWSEQNSADNSAPDTISDEARERAEKRAARAANREFVTRAWNVTESVLGVERANGRLPGGTRRTR